LAEWYAEGEKRFGIAGEERRRGIARQIGKKLRNDSNLGLLEP